jgi:hypothetical protein
MAWQAMDCWLATVDPNIRREVQRCLWGAHIHGVDVFLHFVAFGWVFHPKHGAILCGADACVSAMMHEEIVAENGVTACAIRSIEAGAFSLGIQQWCELCHQCERALNQEASFTHPTFEQIFEEVFHAIE